MASVTSPCVRGANVFGGPCPGHFNVATCLHSMSNLGYFLLVLTLVLTGLAQPASAQQTLFTNQIPVIIGAHDGVSYELGMKFQSSVSGTISAIRYWKDASEPAGNHVGNIWSSTGTLLASTAFMNETASGWQQQSLTPSLTIQANTTYIVSVNIGAYYVATNSGPFFPILKTDAGLFFPVVNGALTSLADGNNGVFGSPGQFPTQSFEFSNYFRDVVFTPTPGVPIPAPKGCLQKLVSVDGGNTFAPYPNFSSPALAQPNTAVEFQLVVTNCGQNPVTPSTVDDCINADPKAAPFACAPRGSGGQDAPGLILYEQPPAPAPTSTPITPGASVTYTKTELPFLNVSATQVANLCSTAIAPTGMSVFRNDAQFDGTANGSPVGYQADAYVQCAQSPITSNCVAINAIENVPITPVTLTATGGAGGPYTFTATGLPPGLSISTSGTISGTPTATGTFSYTVTITDSAGNKGTLNCSVTVAPPPLPTCGTALVPVTYNVNEKNTIGEIAWFNSHLSKLGGSVPTSTSQIFITGGKITFGPSTLSVPDAMITFSSTASCSSTLFNTTFNRWETTLPLSAASKADEIFAAGIAYLIPAGFPQNVNNVTWSANVSASVTGLDVTWQYGVSNWLTSSKGTSFPGLSQSPFVPDYNGMMVDPAHNAPLCNASYNSGDHAGAPEFSGRGNVLTGGGSGGGGSNWTGSWSSTPSQILVCKP